MLLMIARRMPRNDGKLSRSTILQENISKYCPLVTMCIFLTSTLWLASRSKVANLEGCKGVQVNIGTQANKLRSEADKAVVTIFNWRLTTSYHLQ
jgi:hypothetical protein